MSEHFPLTDYSTVKEQLLSMGFDSNHIEDALKLFQKVFGDDYKINILVELTTQIKNKHFQMTEQISNHNKQTIGTQLYHQIYSFEPILAGKITGMMLQWDTNKLMQLLNNPLHLQQVIKDAKSALDNVPFKQHMDLIVVQTLKPGDKIDFRNKNGKFIFSTVLKKQNTQLFIHFDELSYLFDTWCDYTKELYRFAVSGSISARPAHRLQQLSVGDMIDFKPSNVKFNWTNAKIISDDNNSGQIEVMYEINKISYRRWTHKDNINEICVFTSKHEYVDISMDLLNWKALETNFIGSDDSIKNVLLLNNNEIIVVGNRKIYKYQINLNKWTVWITFEFAMEIIACCLNEDKKLLYILSQNIHNCSITQVALLSLKHTVYDVIFPYFFTYLNMLIVEDTLHFFSYDAHYKLVGTHYIWNSNMQQPKVEHTVDNLTATWGSNTASNTAFIYCKERNILLLFGNICGDKLFIYSLKQNKWFSTLINDPDQTTPNQLNTPTPTTQTVKIRNDGSQQQQHYIPAQNAMNASQISLNNSINNSISNSLNDSLSTCLQRLQQQQQQLQLQIRQQQQQQQQQLQLQQLQQQIRQQEQRAHLLDAFSSLFGFVLTNDEKYVMIFAGMNFERFCHQHKYDQVGKIYLLDVSNSELIHCESVNYLLKNTLRAHMTQLNFKLFYPIIINKTTILIDGYVKQCWNGNKNFKNLRLLSGDVISIIKRYYGYDNNELYIYSVSDGNLWNTKVNEIIKHQLPKLNTLQNQTMYQQQFGFRQSFDSHYINSFWNPFWNYQ